MGGSRIGEDIMRRLALETGGRYFEASTPSRSLDATYEQIQEELRNQYSLGYVADGEAQGFRRIRVSLKRKGAIAQTRSGYYAGDSGTSTGVKHSGREK